MNETILLAGCGPMALDYAKVFKAQGVPFLAVGRGADATSRFELETGVRAIPGGVEAWTPPAGMTTAVVAVGERWLGDATLSLLRKGFRRILVEKPGGYDPASIQAVMAEARKADARVSVGYNRRFYASVLKTEELIREDGGVTFFSFEFTEWSHRIKDLPKESGTKEMWFLHNSSHVVDMAFHLGGRPKEMANFTAGGLEWHPSGSVFAGAGVAESGALFSYQANWEAPGRWGVEVMTKKRRFIFRPLEKLQVQHIGSVAVEPVGLEDSLDVDFKPGVFRQVQAFLGGGSGLCTLEEQVRNLEAYRRISRL